MDDQLATQVLLEQWGLMCNRQTGEVKGYPPEVPFYRMMRGTAVSMPWITDSDWDRVDYAVRRLSQRCPDQGAIIKLRYVEYLPPAKIARKIRCGETAARQELSRAVEAIKWILECT